MLAVDMHCVCVCCIAQPCSGCTPQPCAQIIVDLARPVSTIFDRIKVQNQRLCCSAAQACHVSFCCLPVNRSPTLLCALCFLRLFVAQVPCSKAVHRASMKTY